jgi:SAM-dependent methyltransferase
VAAGNRAAGFDTVPELYDRARPAYPAALVDDLVELTGIGPESSVLEIAPGTGQLSVLLAPRVGALTCVELGPALAGVARRNLAPFPHARVEVARFEEWPAPAEPFDAVVCATAFHWLDPAVRVRRSLDLLRPGGSLAVVSTHHVAGGTEAFFVEVQDCYRRWDPSTPPGFRLPAAADVPVVPIDPDGDPRVARSVVRRHEWEAEYTGRSHRDLLATYSPMLAMGPDQREGLLTCVADLVRSRYGDRITMRYLNELQVLRRA